MAIFAVLMFVNKEIELAFDFIAETNTNVFLTGKAGTGKTTFLKRVKQEVNKRMAIVAPTGVAAINAEGVTIHSLFQLPFGPIIPGITMSGNNQRRFNRKKINLIKSLDLLIIDEISMVRADVLDAIDQVLRKYRNYGKPFGGVQVLMIGDLHQLPPVIQGSEWSMLSPHFKTGYFFGSKALEETNYVTIHLQHIYRQADKVFIELLNKVRNNELSESILTELNTRYKEGFEPTEDEGYITLTSHNAAAQRINKERLAKIKTKSFNYKAEIKGEFPEHAYPTSEDLELKVGAQVMFVKNDLSEEKLFYNGKIGKVVSLSKSGVVVQCPGEDRIEVEPLNWENRKFNLNEKTKEVEEDIIGGFKQFPLKLAWAITIHKSQGLTFERVIIDAANAFAHGQVYVALSRCKTFEGIVLSSKIGNNSVKTDAVVKDYSLNALENAPNDDRLFAAKKEYQVNILKEMFYFAELERKAEQYRRLTVINSGPIQNDLGEIYDTFFNALIKEVVRVGHGFNQELNTFFANDLLPEDDEALKERLTKAVGYFKDKLEAGLKQMLDFEPLTDNKEVETNLYDKQKEVVLEFQRSIAGIKEIEKGFAPKQVLQAIANAEIDQKDFRTAASTKKVVVPKNVANKELYETMVKWRREKSQENDYPAYRVLTTKTLLEIVNVLPTTPEALIKISGLGKVKLKEFGGEILKMVEEYCSTQGIAQANLLDFATGPEKKKEKKDAKPKIDTKKVSFDLYKAGKTVEAIAKERDFAQTTIEGHLAHFVGLGELSVFNFVPKEKVQMIVKYFAEADNEGLTLAKEHFKENYTYTELRMAREHWKFVMAAAEHN